MEMQAQTVREAAARHFKGAYALTGPSEFPRGRQGVSRANSDSCQGICLVGGSASL